MLSIFQGTSFRISFLGVVLMAKRRKSKGYTMAMGRINIRPFPGFENEIKKYFDVLVERGDIRDYNVSPAFTKTHYTFILDYPKGRRGSLRNVMKTLRHISRKYRAVTDLTVMYGINPREYVFYPE